MAHGTASAGVEAVFRAEHGRILASLLARTRDFELAEEALQDALARALERWPADGMPARPAAWITTVAERRLVDLARARRRKDAARIELADAEGALPTPEDDMVAEPEPEHSYPDERLRLIFTC